jgi:hypothetical protein
MPSTELLIRRICLMAVWLFLQIATVEAQHFTSGQETGVKWRELTAPWKGHDCIVRLQRQP